MSRGSNHKATLAIANKSQVKPAPPGKDRGAEFWQGLHEGTIATPTAPEPNPNSLAAKRQRRFDSLIVKAELGERLDKQDIALLRRIQEKAASWL